MPKVEGIASVNIDRFVSCVVLGIPLPCMMLCFMHMSTKMLSEMTLASTI